MPFFHPENGWFYLFLKPLYRFMNMKGDCLAPSEWMNFYDINSLAFQPHACAEPRMDTINIVARLTSNYW